MDTKSNRDIITHIVNELSNGNDEPLLESMADNMQWNWMGSGQRSKSFIGKAAVINEVCPLRRTAEIRTSQT